MLTFIFIVLYCVRERERERGEICLSCFFRAETTFLPHRTLHGTLLISSHRLLIEWEIFMGLGLL